ncbi:ABC transporter permease [Labrenzia sp. PHM005]|uniref:ABC transporter permease n=1 Tax=Labrenzia sp. PHM005 TaxID=2590016 RepID=UPI00352E5BFB
MALPVSKAPTLVVTLLLAGPVIAGFAGTILPAFGFLPALGETHWSLAPFKRLLAMPGLEHSIALSFATGLIASLLSLSIVLLFAAGWSGTPTFQAISRFLSPLLSVPHAAAAIGLALLIAPSGFLVRLSSPWATGWNRPPDLLLINDSLGIALTFGLVAKEVPFLFLMTLAALNKPGIKDFAKAGTSLGYGRMATFFKVVLPQIYPLIRLPILAVIAYATSVVDVALILGPTTPAPLAPRLIGWMNDPDLSMRLTASAGAIVQLAVSICAILVYLVLEFTITQQARRRLSLGRRKPADQYARGIALGMMAAIIGAMLLAFLVLCLWAVAKSWWYPAVLPQSWDFTAFTKALPETRGIFATSLILGILAAVLSTGLTLWLLESHTNQSKQTGIWLRTLIFVPLVLPQVAFLFGLQILFLTLGLDGSYLAVLLAHLVFVLPYAFLALSDPWQRLDPRYARLAASMGASRLRIFFKVHIPMLLRPILVTCAVALAVSISQYLPTLLIGAGRLITVTTESVALASGGNRQFAALYALLQLLIPLAGFALAALIPAIVYRHRSAMRLEP